MAFLTKTMQIPSVDKGVHSGKTELFNPQISPSPWIYENLVFLSIFKKKGCTCLPFLW